IPQLSKPQKPPQASRRPAIWVAVFLIALLFIIVYGLSRASSRYPSDTVISVPEGQTLSGVTNSLLKASAVRSGFIFKAAFVIMGGPRGLMAGDYYLEKPQSAFALAWRLTHAEYNLQNVKVTIPEGFNTKEIAATIASNKKFTHFKAADFILRASPYEGYL